MKLGLGEILGKAAKMKTKEEKVEYLRKNDSRSLQDIIQYALHPLIKWDLPEGTPPYSPTPYLDQENMLYHEVKKLRLFVNGNGNNLSRPKLENLFIQILESVAPKDAELLCLVKERKLPKGITPTVINEVWPGLIPDEADKKVSQE
jgi:hypothetical protein